MDVPRCRTRQSTQYNVVAKKSEETEKLRRKHEINARYSRLTVSKTIKYIQKQEQVTMCLSEKCNGNVAGKIN